MEAWKKRRRKSIRRRVDLTPRRRDAEDVVCNRWRWKMWTGLDARRRLLQRSLNKLKTQGERSSRWIGRAETLSFDGRPCFSSSSSSSPRSISSVSCTRPGHHNLSPSPWLSSSSKFSFSVSWARPGHQAFSTTCCEICSPTFSFSASFSRPEALRPSMEEAEAILGKVLLSNNPQRKITNTTLIAQFWRKDFSDSFRFKFNTRGSSFKEEWAESALDDWFPQPYNWSRSGDRWSLTSLACVEQKLGCFTSFQASKDLRQFISRHANYSPI